MKRNLIWNIFGVVILIANLLPTPALAAPRAASGNNPEPTLALPDMSTVLPGWFTGSPANPAHLTASNNVLPDWFTFNEPSNSVRPAASNYVLPGWFAPYEQPPVSPDLAPLFQPLATAIDVSLLTVNVYGPLVASLGSSPLFGEVYTAVIRNGSSATAYGVYVTALHQPYFTYDPDPGVDQILTGTSGMVNAIPFSLTYSSTTITWTPQITLNLAPGEVLTVNFRLRAACDAESGQQTRMSAHYNADPPPALPIEINGGGLNITTGRGNLVIKKEPAIQNLGTTDFGKPITWLVTIQNTGLGVLYNALVSDTGGISLSQPSGDLVPTATVPVLGINATQVFTVVGRVEACNFTNVASAWWTCGNLVNGVVADATAAKPVSSTASILFTPQVPRATVQVSSPITFPYCSAIPRTVNLTLTNAGGPAGGFWFDSDLDNSAFLQVLTPTVSAGWQYVPATGVFTYVSGSPTGTIPALNAASPVTLSFQVQPSGSLCAASSGDLAFEPSYYDVCSGDLFRANPATLRYEYALGQAPTIDIVKSGPALVRSGEVFTYQVTIVGENGINISGTVNITDMVPAEFRLTGPMTVSGGITSVTGQTVTWRFTPTATYGPFTQTLIFVAQNVTTPTVCGAGNIAHNTVQVSAAPRCLGCSLADSASVDTALANSEGITATRSYAGSSEACSLSGGLTFYNQYHISGTTAITWTGAVFTDAMGLSLTPGDGGLPAGTPLLNYVSGTLRVTVGVTNYTLTPTINANGNLVLDLTPLQAAGAPTQNVALLITFTATFTDGLLGVANHVHFHDWSQLYLPNTSAIGACASNNAFNNVVEVTLHRGDLVISVDPPILDRCNANTVTIHVDHPADSFADDLTDHIVVTFTASAAEVQSARNFRYSGSLITFSTMISVVSVRKPV